MAEQLPGGSSTAAGSQPDMYTVLLLVAIVCLCATIGIVLYNLMSPVEAGGYGLSFAELFKPADRLITQN